MRLPDVTCPDCAAVDPRTAPVAWFNEHADARGDRGLVLIAALDDRWADGYEIQPVLDLGAEVHWIRRWEATDSVDRRGLYLPRWLADVFEALLKPWFCRSSPPDADAWNVSVRVALRLKDDPVALQMALAGSEDALKRLVAGMAMQEHVRG